MFCGVCCSIVLFILDGPGALCLVVCSAQDTSSSVIGLVSGLFGSSVERSMVLVGVVRCWCCCKNVLTVFSVCWSKRAFSCGDILKFCSQYCLCSVSMSSLV